MDSASLMSPSSSDKHLWNTLHDRVDVILDDRKPNNSIGWPFAKCDAESERGKDFREDSLLLIRGLDSVSSSLSQLTETLGAAQQGLSNLAKPSIRKVQKRESQRISDEDEQRESKKQCCSNFHQVEEDSDGLNIACNSDSKEEATSVGPKEVHEDNQSSVDAIKCVHLQKAKNLAVSMLSKSVSIARELKLIRTELNFMQEKCTVLEEENRRLREGFEKGEMAEEDDLVRLQLEALLAEKSKLANENANLIRENKCLHQLVEYHQLASQDFSSSYEEEIDKVLLDFSSPERREDYESEDGQQSKEQENHEAAY